jgi:hypothetical protein
MLNSLLIAKDCMKYAILQPALALVIWTLLVWVWMYATRLPAVFKTRPDFRKIKTGQQLRQVLPDKINWVADNYNHLHEQPTLFYVLCVLLYLTNPESTAGLYLAWAYVGFRVMHSLWQILINQVNLRFVLFCLSSLTLILMSAVVAMGFWAT